MPTFPIEFTDPTCALIRSAAERSGVTPTDFIREAAVARTFFEMARRGGVDAAAVERFIEAAKTPAPPEPRRALRTREVCERLAISRTSLYELVRGGRLPSVRLGGPNGPLRYLEEDIDALLEESRRNGPPV